MSVPAKVFDAERLAAVRRTGLLDTPAEEPFDRLAALAATLLDVPLAFITVVDESRSFWKACMGVGTGDRQNTVEESFCQYVIGSEEPLVVGDAAVDERTRENPSIAAMGVRAWAGFPLRAPTGEVLGTFCVVDTRVRECRSATRRSCARWPTPPPARSRCAARCRTPPRRPIARPLWRARLQESLLPPVLPAVPGLRIGADYRPAGSGVDVLGDFYDVFEAAGRWYLVIGDVCGKGVQAAKVTALARWTARRRPCAPPGRPTCCASSTRRCSTNR